MQQHRLPLFGQSAGIILESADRTQPFLFFRFLKKKGDGVWEKPSQGEGKNIKFNLLELIALIDVFKGVLPKWTTVHKFGQETTPISAENKAGNVYISIPGYSRMIKYPETELVARLLDHILGEKVEFATAGFQTPHQKYHDKTLQPVPPSPLTAQPVPTDIPEDYPVGIEQFEASTPLPTSSGVNSEERARAWFETLEKRENYLLVPGEITARREKALSFHVLGFKEVWLPLSQIEGQAAHPPAGGLWLSDWILGKKLPEIFGYDLPEAA
jgi:hypothetical protein